MHGDRQLAVDQLSSHDLELHSLATDVRNLRQKFMPGIVEQHDLVTDIGAEYA